MEKIFVPIFFGAFSLIWIIFAGFWLLWFGIAVLGTIFWIWMLVDVLKREFPKDKENDKIIWLLVVILTHWIGALVYYFLVKKKEKHKEKNK